jgi:hypothetical protein
MLHFWLTIAGGFLWVFALWASFAGWGALLRRVTGLPRGLATDACLGVAFAVVLGGLVNLLRIMGPALAVAFVLAGAVLAAAEYRPWPGRLRDLALPPGGMGKLLLAAAVLLGGVAVFGHVFSTDFNRIDDYPAYLVYPQKMLQTGSLGFEPFSERRLLTSVGGMYFLHGLVLAGASFFFLHAIDPALGLGLALLLLEGALRRHGVGLSARLAVLIFAALLVPSIVNLTAITLPVALMLYAFFLLESGPDTSRPGRIVALALVGAALTAIKSPYLPWIGAFLALVYGGRIIAARFAPRSLVEPGCIVAATVLAFLPWMLANLRDVGTMLYPVLGPGYHASQYGLVPTVWAMPSNALLLRTILGEGTVFGPRLLAALVITGLALCLRAGRDRGGAWLTLAFLAGCLALLVTIIVGTGADSLERYSYPAVAAALMLSVWYFAVTAAPRFRPIPLAVTGLACFAAIVADAHQLFQYYGHAAADFGVAVLGPGIRPAMLVSIITRDDGAQRKDVARMQAAIPAGTPFMERLDYPFLLDFRRNPIFVADYPGAVSLPPGMPVSKGPEPLADYLVQHTPIRLVAYAYGNESLFPYADRAQFPDSLWIQLDTNNAFAFQDDLAALMQTRRLAYKDATRAVIEIGERVAR